MGSPIVSGKGIYDEFVSLSLTHHQHCRNQQLSARRRAAPGVSSDLLLPQIEAGIRLPRESMNAIDLKEVDGDKLRITSSNVSTEPFCL